MHNTPSNTFHKHHFISIEDSNEEQAKLGYYHKFRPKIVDQRKKFVTSTSRNSLSNTFALNFRKPKNRDDTSEIYQRDHVIINRNKDLTNFRDHITVDNNETSSSPYIYNLEAIDN